MTKSTITRERLEALANAEYCKSNPGAWLLGLKEVNELARMALAAMDSSESVELPLDYLQGHKDGLEWAARLAEANHPETGDWLYDDPIELAKAIRKGPDMPPEQPVEDSEPDRNPVLAYADSYRDMAKQGVESVPIWSVITDLERNIAPLYRHAQPAPVVGYVPLGDCPYDVPYSMPSNLRELIAKEIGILFSDDDAQGVWNVCRRSAMLQAGNSPVIPEGYVMVPKEPTAEMVIKMRYHVGGYDRNIKEGYKAMLAAAQQEVSHG
ncbi:DUF551 domain-containing protein [Klebsiella quasipneumoniae]